MRASFVLVALVSACGANPTGENDGGLADDGGSEVPLDAGFGGGSGAIGTPGWTRLTPANSPPSAQSADMAYDWARNRVIWVGAVQVGFEQSFETWEWDGANWTDVTAPGGPAYRLYFKMAYDEVRQRVVLFGGRNLLSSGLDDSTTWERGSAGWIQVRSAHTPQARIGHAMAWDAANQNIVLFGGQIRLLDDLDDTWVWNGVDWVQQTPPSSPPRRNGASLTWDPRNRELLLFGGDREAGGFLADLWAWNGATWVPRGSTSGPRPPARADHSAIYDNARGQFIVWAGDAAGSTSRNDAWAWNGVQWLERTDGTRPPVRIRGSLVWHEVDRRFLLFGGWGPSPRSGRGLRDTWAFVP